MLGNLGVLVLPLYPSCSIFLDLLRSRLAEALMNFYYYSQQFHLDHRICHLVSSLASFAWLIMLAVQIRPRLVRHQIYHTAGSQSRHLHPHCLMTTHCVTSTLSSRGLVAQEGKRV